MMANPKTGPATLKDLPKLAAAAPGYNFGSGRPGVDRPHRGRNDQARL